MPSAMSEGISRAARPEQEPLLSPSSSPVTGGRLPGVPGVLLLCCFSACLGAFSFGYIVGFTSPALAPMQRELQLSTSDASFFSSLVPLGAMPGALSAGPLSEHYGRRIGLSLSAILLSVHWLLIAFSSWVPALLFSRFLGGLGVGIASLTVPVYIAEISPDDLRGWLGSCNQLFIAIGTAVVYCLGLAIIPPPPPPSLSSSASPLPPHSIAILLDSSDAYFLSSWRLLALAGLVPALGLLISIPFVQESPRWLARHADATQVREALRKLRGAKGSPTVNKTDSAEKAEEGGGGGGGRRVVEIVEVDPIEEEVQGFLSAGMGQQGGGIGGGGIGEGQESGAVAEAKLLRLAPNWRPLLVGIGLMVVQQLSGINAVIFFAASIFASAGFTNPNVPSCIVAIIQVLVTFCSSLLIDRLGRRPLLLLSTSGMALFSLGLGFAFLLQQSGAGANVYPLVGATISSSLGGTGSLLGASGTFLSDAIPGFPASKMVDLMSALSDYAGILSGICCVAFVVAFALGVGPLPWLIMSEILPAEVKGVASSLVVLSNWFLCFTVTQTFAALQEWSPYGVFWLYSTVCFLGTLFSFRFVPETKNKSLEEISEFFS